MPVVAAVLVGTIAGLGGAVLTERSTISTDQDSRSDAPQELAEQVSTAGTGEGATVVAEETSTAGGAQGSTQDAGQSAAQDTLRADVAVSDAGTVVAETDIPLGPASTNGESPLSVNSVRFVPGTVELTAESQRTVAAVARALVSQPQAVLEGTLRTSSETSDEDNQALGQRQVAALVDRFTALGVSPSQLDLEPIGRAMVTVRLPAPNFVDVRTGLGQSPLQEAVSALPIYSIGLDPSTGELRAEAIAPLAHLADALLADTGNRSVSLAAYAFTGTGTSTNDQLAARAAAVVENYLVDVHGIDPSRIDLIIVGDAPYAVPAETGSHLVLRLAP